MGVIILEWGWQSGKKVTFQATGFMMSIQGRSKNVNGLLPDYLQSFIEASFQDNYPLRSISAWKLKAIPSRTKSFKFQYCIDEWNKLKAEVRN